MSDQTVPEKPATEKVPPASSSAEQKPREHGGPKGLEPTRYNDWERNGRCIDF